MRSEGGGEEVCAGLGADYFGSAEELFEDGGDDACAEGEGDQGEEGGLHVVAIVPGAEAAEHEDDGGGGHDDGGKDEVAADGAEGGRAPGEQRADAGEEEEEEADGDVDAVVERRAYGDLGALDVLAEDGEERAPEDGEAGGEQDHVVEQEAGLAADEGLELVFGLQVVAVAEEGEEADGEDDEDEGVEPVADVRLGEGVDGADQAGAGEQRAEDGEHEGGEDEPDVPVLHHAALFLHHDGVQEGGAGEPGHERGVFDGVPAPVASPAEDGVGPVRAHEDADGEEEPGDHGPAAGDVDPLFAGVAHHQRAEGEGEGDREADVAEVEHRGMHDHLGVLEEGIEACSVERQGAGCDGEGRRGEGEQEEEEDFGWRRGWWRRRR